jgi:hypothetical protein
MQSVAPASAAVLAAAFLLLHGSGAWGAETKPSCGASTQEAIASAQRALNNKSPDEQRAAISCLIQALNAVDARLHAVEAAALIAPKSEGRNQR